MIFTIATVALLLFIVTYYVIIKWKTSYWKRKGVDFVEPELFYGNYRNAAKGKLSLGDFGAQFYKHFKKSSGQHGGLYAGTSPVYIPVDLEIIKSILQKDFSHFVNRGGSVDEELDPVNAHLFNLENEKWRNLRTKLTPAFTSGQMKMMFPTMAACTEGLKDIVSNHADASLPIDIKDVLGRFTTDIIGSVAFGIDCNTLKYPNSDFRTYGKKSALPIKKSISETFLRLVFSREALKKLGLKYKQMAQDVEDFFLSIVKSTVNYRETNNIYRRDILQLLLQLKNTGILNDDKHPDFGKPIKSEKEFLTLNQITAQCFVFFFAGFETSSTTMTFALLELALNKEIQTKLRKEIATLLKEHGNQVTYDAIMGMTYLDKVVHETLRKHPPLPFTPRKCNKDYKVPNTNLILEAGTAVMLSIQGIHTDPEYYPDPERFDPERFNEQNKAKRPATAFLPFGDGPRNCIGSRFGLLQVKVGLVAIISSFEVTLNEKTKSPIEHAPDSVITAVKGDVWLNVNKI